MAAPAKRDYGAAGQIKFISQSILDHEFAAYTKRAIVIAYDISLVTHGPHTSPLDYYVRELAARNTSPETSILAEGAVVFHLTRGGQTEARGEEGNASLLP